MKLRRALRRSVTRPEYRFMGPDYTPYEEGTRTYTLCRSGLWALYPELGRGNPAKAEFIRLSVTDDRADAGDRYRVVRVWTSATGVIHWASSVAALEFTTSVDLLLRHHWPRLKQRNEYLRLYVGLEYRAPSGAWEALC